MFGFGKSKSSDLRPTEKEIKEALNMNDEEISLFREIKERRENFLSML